MNDTSQNFSLFYLVYLSTFLCLILANCNPGCANGGTCLLPNLCICAVGWTGPDCNTSKI